MCYKYRFVGATDSAAPVGLMLHLAEVLTPIFKSQGNATLPCLRMIFFDGEEAFRTWTSTDSVYGARHLAEKWCGGN